MGVHVNRRPDNYTELVAFRLEPGEKDVLERAARRRGGNMSAQLRSMIAAMVMLEGTPGDVAGQGAINPAGHSQN